MVAVVAPEVTTIIGIPVKLPVPPVISITPCHWSEDSVRLVGTKGKFTSIRPTGELIALEVIAPPIYTILPILVYANVLFAAFTVIVPLVPQVKVTVYV